MIQGGWYGDPGGVVRLSDQVAPGCGRFPMLNQRAQKSIEDMFKEFHWAKNDRPITHEDHRQVVRNEHQILKDKLKNLGKGKTTAPNAAKVAEARRLLGVLRGKLDAAAAPEVLGRCTKRQALVAEAEAEMAAVETAQQERHKKQEKLLSNIARDTALLQALPGKELDTRGADAFKLLGKAAKDAMAGQPDGPVDELTKRLTSTSVLMKPEGRDELHATKATWQGKPVELIGTAVSENPTPNYCFRLVVGGDSGEDLSEELYQCPEEELEMPEKVEEPPAKRPRTGRSAGAAATASASSGGEKRAALEV